MKDGGCLYRCGSGAESTQTYHVLPRSASTLDITLEPGRVCDRCNEYFATKLEAHFVQRHPGSSERLRYVATTRKKKPPRFETTRGTAIRRNNVGTHELAYPLDNLSWEELPNGDLRFFGTFQGLPFDATIISRLLAKISLEFLVTVSDTSPYWPYLPSFDQLRRYARCGDGRVRFVWFAWKRTSTDQVVPLFIEIKEDDGSLVTTLVRISFPGVAYLFPIAPFVAPERIPNNLAGWKIVAEAREFQPDHETIEVNLVRKSSSSIPQPSKQSSSSEPTDL